MILFYRYILDTCSMLNTTTCAPCSCNTEGSTSTSCDSNGACTCKPNFHGTKCQNRDCIMTPWGAWTTCPCGTTNQRTRTRTVSLQPLGTGKRCPGTSDTGTCPMVPCDCKKLGKPDYYGNRCEKRDCKLGPWSAYSRSNCGIKMHVQARVVYKQCLYTCPGSASSCEPMQTRSRSVSVTKVGDGQDCHGSRTDETGCGHRCERKCRRSTFGICQEYWYLQPWMTSKPFLSRRKKI